MRPIKVSVSITTFNHERFIRQAIESVLGQSCRAKVEVVVGDDCSTDGTADILASLAREHRGVIKVIRPEENLGHSGRPMFMKTLRHCDGNFVAMLDGDDYWTSPNKLENQLDFFSRYPECALCHHAVESVYEDGHTDAWAGGGDEQESILGFASLLPWHYIGSPAPMVRRKVIRALPGWVHRSPFGDWPIYLLAAEHGPIGFLPQPMAAYRFHAGGAWTQAHPAERQQQVVDFFANIGGGMMRRRAKPLLQALTFHLLELAMLHQEQGLLVDCTGAPMGGGDTRDLMGYRDTQASVTPQPFRKAAIHFFESVGGKLRDTNGPAIARALCAQLFLAAEEHYRQGLRREAASLAVRSYRADRAMFVYLSTRTFGDRLDG